MHTLAMLGFGGMAGIHYKVLTKDYDKVKVKGVYDIDEKRMEDAKRKTERFSSDFETKANVLSDEIKEGQKKMQNEYITILGIIAAIVLAFTGGMTFTSSVLENIHKSSIYRIAFITLIIGCILFNLIWLLIDFIRNMNEKAIKKKWMFWTFNLMFICLMIFTFVAYKYNWMAKEEIINQRFQDEQQVEEQK